MSDKTFERSLTLLTVLVVLGVILGIILGIVFRIIGWLPVVLIGLAVEIVGGGFLLHYWGKSYMERQT